MRVVEGALFGDPDEQHRVEPRRPLGARSDTQAALRAGPDPGDRIGRRRLAPGQTPQAIGRRLGVGAAQANVIDHGTGVETGTACRAQMGELRPRLSQEILGRLGARRLQLGHCSKVQPIRPLGQAIVFVSGSIGDFRAGSYERASDAWLSGAGLETSAKMALTRKDATTL